MLMVLVAVAVLAGLAASASYNHALRLRREKEAERRFALEQFETALRSYASVRGGQADLLSHPESLNDLLEDRASGLLRRHLRRLYIDPFTGAADWVLVRERERIVAVRSRDLAQAPGPQPSPNP